jgi:hypothetical protein
MKKSRLASLLNDDARTRFLPKAASGLSELGSIEMLQSAVAALPQSVAKSIFRPFDPASIGRVSPNEVVARADLPVVITKASASSRSLGTYPQLNGRIVGLYTEMASGSVNALVPGVPPASLSTTSAALGVTLGYLFTPKGSSVSYSAEATSASRIPTAAMAALACGGRCASNSGS